MEIIFNSVRNLLYGFIVVPLNIPIFWSISGFLNFIKDVIKTLGVEV